MGGAGNAERLGVLGAGAVFHQIGRVEGNIALVQNIDLTRDRVMGQFRLGGELDPRQLIGR